MVTAGAADRFEALAFRGRSVCDADLFPLRAKRLDGQASEIASLTASVWHKGLAMQTNPVQFQTTNRPIRG